jgi:hypothetical protein
MPEGVAVLGAVVPPGEVLGGEIGEGDAVGDCAPPGPAVTPEGEPIAPGGLAPGLPTGPVPLGLFALEPPGPVT